jgi:glycosyltransferase involved in cell wall biosynthesis
MRFALCLEQTLGHRAHSANLASALAASDADVDFVDVQYNEGSRVPWAFRGSWEAAKLLRRRRAHDARLFHTQSISLFAPLVAQGRPFVVSVDATPKQIDQMGVWYRHSKKTALLERAKERWYRAVFGRASALVAWSEWAADSLVADYEVPREKIAILHPGAPAGMFLVDREPQNLPTILFVGGDLARKGGDLLLDAFRQLSGRGRLLLVTPDDVAASEGVEVVHGATPGSPALIDAYRRADIFCLPTRGDCTPVVLGEAMAAGLPVITTRIGSNVETVTDGVEGILIDVDDAAGLSAALSRLVADPALRNQMGGAARAKAVERYDAEKNAFRILALLRSVAK